MACVCVKDSFGDIHARRIYGEASPELIKDTAVALAEDVPLERHELVDVGLAATDDSGVARLSDRMDYGDGGIEWLHKRVAILEEW